jgi:hypothetical protein
MSHILNFKHWFKLNEAEGDPGENVILPTSQSPVDKMSPEEKSRAELNKWAQDQGKNLMNKAVQDDEQIRSNRVIKDLKEAAGGFNLGKNVINLRGNAHLQTLLKKLGVLKSKAGPLGDGVTCYFNGETEAALMSLCGLDQIDFSNPESMTTFVKSWVNREEVLAPGFNKSLITERDQAILAKKPELKDYIDTGLMRPYYEQQWVEGGGRDYNAEGKMNLTGDILEDMYKFNSIKEGGLSDDPRDTGPAALACPYEFDSATGKLTYNGMTYQLSINPHLQNSKSLTTGTTKSNRWHTSRGVIWPTWKAAAADMGISNPLEVAKGFFEMKDEYAKRVYELTFYNKTVRDAGRETLSTLVNHCIGTASWGSPTHAEKTIANTINALNGLGYSGLDDAIQKIGDKIVTEIMLVEQVKLYLSYKNAATYGRGWTGGLINFHRYFIPVYADMPAREKFPDEYAKRERSKTQGFSGLDQLA